MTTEAAATIRSDWTIEEVQALYDLPLLALVQRAGAIHAQFHEAGEVQVNELLSIKTGGCPEDCGYCSQSAHHDADVQVHALMQVDDVLRAARRAKANGVTRFCMGAAWREVKDNPQFERVLEMVRGVDALGLESCVTLGMLTADQATRLADAGLHSYNHNLDTSPEHYPNVVTTRTYQERLDTIANVRAAGVNVCCGGILGLGETHEDRVSFLQTLATLDPHPDSVPINVLSRVPGTPMADQDDVPIEDTVRTIALARILMPAAMVRISAGRHLMSFSDQAMCFLAGANSIFSSDRNLLLTEPSPSHTSDRAMFQTLGIRPKVLAPAGDA